MLPDPPASIAPGARARLLVVEDDAGVASGLVRGLREAGFEVELASDGAQARVALARGGAALMVLDLMLPVVSGLELLESIRERPHPPIIVLTARTDLGERLRCFALGAVDFVPKPFFLEELVARIGVRLRLSEEAPRRVVAWANCALDLDRRQVTVGGRERGEGSEGGQEVALTRHELDILAYLVQRPGRAVTREQLAERALSGIDAPEPRTIDTHVARVRKKLGAEGAAAIATVWGIGYRFDPGKVGG